MLIFYHFNFSDFEILAFPCNQFGGQEPGTNEQIVEFACTRFKAEYPIFDKVCKTWCIVFPLFNFSLFLLNNFLKFMRNNLYFVEL